MHRFRSFNSRSFRKTTMTEGKHFPGLACVTPSKDEYDLQRVLLISKTTRFEVEQQNNPEFDESSLRKLFNQRGLTSITRSHDEHKRFQNGLVEALNKLNVDVRIVNRFDSPVNLIDWADTVISVGGDGTYLMAANKVADQSKPVIGLNSCPDTSTGYLCLPKKYSKSVYETLRNIKNRNFTWAYRTRIRVTLVGRNIEKCSQPVHDSPHNLKKTCEEIVNHNSRNLDTVDETYVVPNLALNEVFIAESAPATVSYLDIALDDGDLIATKNSGLLVCTGSGSSSWNFTMNRISHEVVEKIFDISGYKNANVDDVVEKYNNSLRFAQDDGRMDYTIRDLIPMSVWPKMPDLRSKGYVSKMLIKSQCRNGSMVIDGGCSYNFNTGTSAILETGEQYVLKTIKFFEDSNHTKL